MAFCSVFIVVLSAIIVNTVISKGPIIFLKLAEGTTGEIDAIVTPTQVPLTSFNTYNNFDGIFLNYTQVLNLYNEEYNLSPRKQFCNTYMSADPFSNLIVDYQQNPSSNSWTAEYDMDTLLPNRE